MKTNKLTPKTWSIRGVRGGMEVKMERYITIYIQDGIARVYKLAELKQETEVGYLTFPELDNWLESVSEKLN